jgi:hypothetical protein
MVVRIVSLPQAIGARSIVVASAHERFKIPQSAFSNWTPMFSLTSPTFKGPLAKEQQLGGRFCLR